MQVNLERQQIYPTKYAGMAELADALDSGSNGRKAVQVQVLLPAPQRSVRKNTPFSFVARPLTGKNR